MTQAHPPVTDQRSHRSRPAVVHATVGRYCASVDYDAAERIFAEDVVSFGTAMDIVSGRRALREGQWESIWGNITNFKMDLDNVNAQWKRQPGLGQWSHGRPQALTETTSRSIVRGGRPLH